ncbi:MAG: hypothetical protein HOY79_28865 [Streptomyces sp.]|nr:hypothetical protein [Streptomyces sp.]
MRTRSSSAEDYEPPPDPRDWICDALPSHHISESPDTRYAAPSRQEEPMTWDVIRTARPVHDYEPRHGAPARY